MWHSLLSDKVIQSQIIIIFSSIVIGYVISSTLKMIFPALATSHNFNAGTNKTFLCKTTKCLHFTPRMVTCLCIISCLIMALVVGKYYLSSTSLIDKATRIGAVILIVQALDSMLASHPGRFTAMVLIGTPVILQLFGILAPAIKYMDSLSFNLGNVNLSIFIIIKALYLGGAIFWVGNYIAKIVEKFIRSQEEWGINNREILVKLFDTILYFVLFLIGLNVLGVDLTILNIFSGAIGAAFVLSLQKITSNFISGLIILSERSIKLHDHIEIIGSVSGKVKFLGARAAIIEESAGNQVFIPNEDLITSKVINLSTAPRKTIDFEVCVSLESDPNKVIAAILSAINEHNAILKEPQPQCLLTGFNNNSIRFDLSLPIDNGDKSLVQSEIMALIWHKLNQAGIKLA